MAYKTTLPLLSIFVMALSFAMPHAAMARDNDRNNNRGNDGRGRIEQRHDNRHDNGNHNGWNHNNQQRGRVTYYQPPVRPPVRYVYNNPRTVYYYNTAPRYRVGQRVMYYQPVPQYVLYQLRPAPHGYYYTMQDQNVFLVSQRDNTIAQIISLLLD